MHVVIHYAWKGKFLELQLYNDSSDEANILARKSGMWMVYDWKISEKDTNCRKVI